MAHRHATRRRQRRQACATVDADLGGVFRGRPSALPVDGGLLASNGQPAQD
jgi:ribosomal protein L34E